MGQRKTKYKIEWNGFEPTLIIEKEEPGYHSIHKIVAFYQFRKIHRILKTYAKKKELIKLGITPVRCEGVEFVIEDPNEPLGTDKKTFVCQDCVYYYDYKWTHIRLYNTPTDWRDDYEQFRIGRSATRKKS